MERGIDRSTIESYARNPNSGTRLALARSLAIHLQSSSEVSNRVVWTKVFEAIIEALELKDVYKTKKTRDQKIERPWILTSHNLVL
jgi:hypothetical protein